ncbi:PQQ-dependent sugar dehydrogenase [Streptomyces sp. NPDC051940]|uniref:PQQ-dependent sugar dehydrogenase n=1 Tax=Streptomyces sp. NPDC051940 TaxID=3155675 RepID=UPI00342FA00B
MPKFRTALVAVAVAAVALLPIPQTAAADAETTAAGLADPIPEEPTPTDLGLELTEFAQLPRSQPATGTVTDGRLMRYNRINYLGEVPDGSGRLYVPDLNGKMYLLDADGGGQHTYLDVGASFAPQFFSHRGLGQGFGFVAYHPDYAANGKFYTVHVELASLVTKPVDFTAQPGTTYHGVITEWTADDPAADTFSGTHREVMRIGFNGQIHGIQEIGFNPTAAKGTADYGKLYIAAGDGGRGARNDDPRNLAIPHGKVLRIDPLGTNSANGQYGVPADNPLLGKDGALGEIYAYGFRDPHRFSWDPGGTHRMFLGNIGEKAVEEIEEIVPGGDYGWSEREGTFAYNRSAAADPCSRLSELPADDAKNGYKYPVAQFDHNPPPGWNCTDDVGHAVIGGFVYRANKLPGLQGKYVFADNVSGRLFYTHTGDMQLGEAPATIYQMMVYDGATGERTTMQGLQADTVVGDVNRVDLRFGRNSAGELFVLNKGDGKIYKVTDTRRFASCEGDSVTQTDLMDAGNWDPVTPSKWQFPGDQVILAEAGVARPGPRRPFEYAVLKNGPVLGDAQVDAEVRLDTPVSVSNRDVIIVFGWKSDTEFYYAHLSQDNTIYPHNGIFRVNNADRVRIEDQWDAVHSHGAPPSVTDTDWHGVRVKHCAATGEIAVYVDGSDYPRMTAVDKTFTSGRVGFGSFDNIGRMRELTVTGTPVG